MHELTPLGSIFKKPLFLESYPEYPILRFFWSVAKNGLLISVFVQNLSNCDLQTKDTRPSYYERCRSFYEQCQSFSLYIYRPFKGFGIT